MLEQLLSGCWVLLVARQMSLRLVLLFTTTLSPCGICAQVLDRYRYRVRAVARERDPLKRGMLEPALRSAARGRRTGRRGRGSAPDGAAPDEAMALA